MQLQKGDNYFLEKEAETNQTTQWLHRAQQLYSMYVQNLAMSLNQAGEAPEIKNQREQAFNYLQVQENLLQLIEGVKKDKQLAILSQQETKDFKQKMAGLSLKHEQFEEKIMESYQRNRAEQLITIVILQLIEKQVAAFNHLALEFYKNTVKDGKGNKPQQIDCSGLSSGKLSKQTFQKLAIIKQKIFEQSSQTNIGELQLRYHQKIRVRDQLKKEVENIIGSDVDFKQTIALYEQRLSTIHSITQKQRKMADLQAEIREHEQKAQILLGKIRLIDMAKISKQREREKEASAAFDNRLEMEQVYEGDQRVAATRLVKVSKRKQVKVRWLLGGWLFCLIIAMLFGF